MSASIRSDNHTLRQLESTADRGIKSFGDQVDLAVVELPVDADPRVLPHELRERVWQLFA